MSLTSVVCKLLESLLRDVLLKFVDSNNKIVPHQYGFWPGYSCVPQLLNVCELHCDFDCIYLDFAKAFDKVSHHKLIYKISDIEDEILMNFTPTLIPWGIVEQQHILWATFTEFAKANLNFRMENFEDCICFS